ncbi:MAG TPA: glycine oxidase ThiO [Solirubrobacterales bacterium]|nr:glycine oxidase ThiO [Solirubrobacterales bacterium]
MPSENRDTLDVVVVGGGAIGLACAWRAAQRGLTVRVLERDGVGSGASGVAAGMLAPVGEATWGEDAFLELALRSHELWPAFARELAEASGRDVGFLAVGALHVAFDRDEAEELRRRYELMTSLGLDAQWLRPSECRALEPGLSPGITGGVSARHEGALDPRSLVAALKVAAERAGAEVREGVEVVELLREGDAVRGARDSEGAEHLAGAVVLAAGAWSGGGLLSAEERPAVRPVKGQILTVRGEAAEPLCERIVVSERVYIVPRGDGRVVIGATVEELGFDLRVTAGGVHELLREAYRALPDVGELELVETIAGLRPGTPDNAPLIGRSGVDGLLLATGHFRNGILLAPVTAASIADLLTESEPPPELAAADPGRFGAVTAP